MPPAGDGRLPPVGTTAMTEAIVGRIAIPEAARATAAARHRDPTDRHRTQDPDR